MRNSMLSTFFRSLPAVLGALALSPAEASQFSVIYTFQSPSDGYSPGAGVTADADGTLYGTTYAGGLSSDCGTVFSLTKPANGGTVWAHKIIRLMGRITSECHPNGTPVVDSNFVYSTTNGSTSGYASVFRTAKDGAGYKTLHKFARSDDLQDSLTFGANGTLFGVTGQGGQITNCGSSSGSLGEGVLFKLRPSGDAFDDLHDFGRIQLGSFPNFAAFGTDGAIYGHTRLRCTGGRRAYYEGGVVFRKSAPGYSVLYAFPGAALGSSKDDPVSPAGQLAFGLDGTIYGTTSGNTTYRSTVWSLKPGAAGQPWMFTVLYEFPSGTGADGVVRDSAGNLYGIAYTGNYDDSLYRLTPPATGNTWTFTNLRNLYQIRPGHRLLLHGGSLFGTTQNGGKGYGTVFKYTVP